ncbi:deoxycytidylate deaminase [Kiloniella sp. b19]|uniref:deoxycytidylate deaminase n=1 Tax=Kiloniella sp. GXU_MW_B19 TaxID=3141326 RepID=UPI0031CE1AEA
MALGGRKPSQKWDSRYIRLAREVASWSKDRSTQVGAVIILADGTPGPYGFNGFPSQVNDDIDGRHGRPVKYDWTEHAERNAIYHAARVGISLSGGSVYVTHFPCPDCCRAIIQSGIKAIIVDGLSKQDRDFTTRWEIAKTQTEMLDEAGVAWRFVDVVEDIS